METRLTIETIEKIFQGRFSSADHIELLWKGRDTFEALFEAIREAREFICLQFYIFKNDETGKALADLLKEKSREGVKVCLLHDHFGSFGTPAAFWEEMKEAGVRIRASRPFKWTKPLRYVHRDHRKLIVIDAKKAFTGGLNIANEYSGFHLRRRSRGWRDTGLLLKGPVVRELFAEFRKSWHTWGGERILFQQTGEDGSKQAAGGGIPALPIFVYSGRGRRRMRNLLHHSIDQARETIFLTTAYFIPSRSLIRKLERAVKRGVEVCLLVPGKSDVPVASFAGRAFFGGLLKAGVRIHTYLGEMLHAKTYVFDRRWSIVGSTNLDYQSLMYNDEGNVGLLDTRFGQKMAEVFEDDLKHSVPIDPERWERRPFFERIRDRFFALFRKRL